MKIKLQNCLKFNLLFFVSLFDLFCLLLFFIER